MFLKKDKNKTTYCDKTKLHMNVKPEQLLAKQKRGQGHLRLEYRKQFVYI